MFWVELHNIYFCWGRFQLALSDSFWYLYGKRSWKVGSFHTVGASHRSPDLYCNSSLFLLCSDVASLFQDCMTLSLLLPLPLPCSFSHTTMCPPAQEVSDGWHQLLDSAQRRVSANTGYVFLRGLPWASQSPHGLPCAHHFMFSKMLFWQLMIKALKVNY